MRSLNFTRSKTNLNLKFEYYFPSNIVRDKYQISCVMQKKIQNIVSMMNIILIFFLQY